MGQGTGVRRPGSLCPHEQKPTGRWNSRPQESDRRGAGGVRSFERFLVASAHGGGVVGPFVGEGSLVGGDGRCR